MYRAGRMLRGGLVAFTILSVGHLRVGRLKGSCGFARVARFTRTCRSRTPPLLLCFIRRDGLCRPGVLIARPDRTLIHFSTRRPQ